jgi:CubicO group peptidase (beta-lactamase class C family)
MKKILISFSIFCCYISCQKEIPPISPTLTTETFNNPLISQLDKDVHQLYQGYKSKMNAVSISFGILENETLHIYGYGETILGNHTAPNENTFYEMGSISKVFTAIATSIWLKENNLSLNTKIKNYIPNYIPTIQKNAVEVCFKNLLTHSAGFDRDPMEILLSANIPNAYANYDSNKFYNYLETVQLNTTPGTLYDYSNIGFGLMGTILERQNHKSYESIIKEKITTPLNMNNTKVTLSANEVQNMAYPYLGKTLQPAIQFKALNGAGSLKSTTKDMLNFAKSYINYSGSTALANAMKECALIQYTGNDAAGGQIQTGLAWDFLPLSSTNLYPLVHSGATFGHSSVLIINKKDKKALIMFITMPGSSMEETAMQDFGNKLIMRALN